jgi:hypothetical protein
LNLKFHDISLKTRARSDNFGDTNITGKVFDFADDVVSANIADGISVESDGNFVHVQSGVTVGQLFFTNNVGEVTADKGFFIEGTVSEFNFNGSNLESTGIALHLTGTVTDFKATDYKLVSSGDDAMDIVGGTIGDGFMSIGSLDGQTGYALNGDAAGANINGRFKVADSNFMGSISPLNGILSTDLKYTFRDVTGVKTSMVELMASTSAGGVTTILDGTPVQVVATWSSASPERATIDAAGTITYNGLSDTILDFAMATSVEKGGSGSDSYFFRLMKNPVGGGGPTAVANSSLPQTLNVDPTSVTWHGIDPDAITGDEYFIAYEGNGTTDAITTDGAQIKMVGTA